MPINIYNKEFKNWLKGVLGLNTAQTALCDHISDKLDEDLIDIPPLELKQFFICLDLNKISLLRTQQTGFKQWSCSHDKCKILMERFVNNHVQKQDLKFKWEETTSSGSIGEPNTDNQEEDLKWKVMKLYMHIDKDEAIENYTSLKSLDIARVIKLMRSCKLFFPDGSAEPYEKVLEWRNKLMHSPDNMMKEDETQEIIKWTKALLDCLDITEKTYYKDAIAGLEDIAKKDFVIKCQSEESKTIRAKVKEAKTVADELYKNITDDEQLRTSKRVLDILENIGGFGITANEGLVYKQAEYKSKIKEVFEQKSVTIELDKAECDKESEDFKKLDVLQQHTGQNLQEVKKEIERLEPEEMVDKINNLDKELESKKLEEVQLIRLKKDKEEAAKTIVHLQNKVRKLEKEKIVKEIEVQRYKNENETLKECTSVVEESRDEPQFQQTIDTLPEEIGNERGGHISNQSQIESKYAEDDIQQYINGNTEKEDDSNLDENDKFFMDEIHSRPNGDEPQFQQTIDTLPKEIGIERDGHVLEGIYAEDIQQYINGYPEQEDDLNMDENYKFFMNEIPSRPNGDYIDTIHKEWWGDYKRLEEDRNYMQWLFPIREKSCNRHSQELFPHEIQI
ncbi:uncharacterized protein LOC132736653 isoform X2 [Ruditapes philippinarum]|uniref:uncharacterized protein LOC132736653 isoform X2 n=1 Tax=Ruditapes philippinarum TaxID=129788 RepID=UPI00295B1A08|nr:uncharacterized protein LOC132736653 isoform X2 [Ruditapes philippinarum]